MTANTQQFLKDERLHSLQNIAFRPYWWEAAEPASPPREPIAQTCDVAIIGAGYTGLSAALTLARAGRHVQVFDRQRPGEGASSRNGGITSGNLRLSLPDCMARYGAERGLALYRESVEARADLRRFITEENIDCDYVASGRYTCCLTDAHYEAQARDTELLNHHLNIGGFMVPPSEQHKETGSRIYRGGVVRPDIGMLHPAKFAAGMLRVARSAGATVHGETGMTSWSREKNGFRIVTLHGETFARNILFAVNGYMDGANKWYRRRIVPIPSCMIVTEPLPETLMNQLMPSRRAMGETRKLYRYFRPSPDGQRIMLGGRSAAFGRTDADTSMHLQSGLIEMYPELKDYRITHSWHGLVAFSRAEIPVLFQHDGAIYAGGYSGSGVVWAHWFGQKMAHKILGSPEGHSAFDCNPPSAVPLFNGRPWFLPVALGWQGLQDRWEIGLIKKKQQTILLPKLITLVTAIIYRIRKHLK